MGKCLVLDEYPENRQAIIRTIQEKRIPWELFVQSASAHLVLPAIYVKFRNAGLLSHLPKELSLHLKKLYDLNLDRNLKILGQVEWLTALLIGSHIRPVFLKGCGALLNNLYEDHGERVINDIDCLVSETDFLKAAELVRNAGYSTNPYRAGSLPLMHHFPALFKAGEPAVIEIHRYPVGVRQLKYPDVQKMVASLREPGSPAPEQTLSPEDQVVVNFIHSQIKDKGQSLARVSMRNLYEFYRLSLQGSLHSMKFHSRYLKSAFNNYAALAAKMFSPATSIPYKATIGARWYKYRLDKNKASRLFYKTNQIFHLLNSLLNHYLHILKKALYMPEYRKHLWVRFTDPAWYRHHLAAIVSSFY